MVGKRRCSAMARAWSVPTTLPGATAVLSSIKLPARELPSKMTERGPLEQHRFAGRIEKMHTGPIGPDAADFRERHAGGLGRRHQGIPGSRRHRGHHLVIVA